MGRVGEAQPRYRSGSMSIPEPIHILVSQLLTYFTEQTSLWASLYPSIDELVKHFNYHQLDGDKYHDLELE